jgi:hypothetical protein
MTMGKKGIISFLLNAQGSILDEENLNVDRTALVLEIKIVSICKIMLLLK